MGRTDRRLTPRQEALRAKIAGRPGSPDYFDGRTQAEVEESRIMWPLYEDWGLHRKRKARRARLNRRAA